MKKQAKRWPIWKLTLVTVGCGLAAAALFWLSAFVDTASSGLTTNPAGRSLALTPGSFIMMAAAVAAALGILAGIRLVSRIWEARLPVWERGRGKKRR